MSRTYEPAHREAMRQDMLSQFRGKDRIEALVHALAHAVQRVEDEAFDLLVTDTLDSATGFLLDRWGKLVDESRLDLDDEDYRRVLKLKIRAQRSEGTVEEILDVWERITNADAFQYESNPPAAYTLVREGNDPLTTKQIRRIERIMDLMRPAGVEHRLVDALPDPFQYDDGPGYDDGAYATAL